MEISKKVAFALAAYFIAMALIVMFLNSLMELDVKLFFLIRSFYNPYVEDFLGVATYLGSSVFWVLAIITAWLKKDRKLSVQLLFAFVLDTILLSILKIAFMRKRPFEAFPLGIEIDANMGPSLPSGHTERAFSGALILSRYYKKYSVVFYALGLLVALSRIYLGLHYPLDTLMGAMTGVIVGMVSLSLPTKWIERRLQRL